jgi:hypothetical protein
MPLIMLAGLGALSTLGYWFHNYLEHLPTDSTGQMRNSSLAVLAALQIGLYGGGAMLAALAVYWLRLSRRIQVAARYPLPQMRLFHDMTILTGTDKQAYARRMRRGAVLAACGAAATLAWAAWAPQREAAIHPILFDRSLPDHRFDEVFHKQP